MVEITSLFRFKEKGGKLKVEKVSVTSSLRSDIFPGLGCRVATAKLESFSGLELVVADCGLALE